MSGWSGAGAFSDGKLSLSEEVGGNIVEYMSREEARELIRYADSIYTAFGAPDKVHGLNDKRVEEIDYECSRHNIHLIHCPVRTWERSTALKRCGICTAGWWNSRASSFGS